MPGDDVRTAVREAIDQVYSDGSRASTREAAMAALRSICERRGSSRSSFTAATAELAN
jgi:hypothetical protein